MSITVSHHYLVKNSRSRLMDEKWAHRASLGSSWYQVNPATLYQFAQLQIRQIFSVLSSCHDAWFSYEKQYFLNIYDLFFVYISQN